MLGIGAAFALWTAGAADLTWQTDLPKALTQAKTENKLVLLDFTGSDWCPPCKLLEENTFSQPEFGAYARTNLVLVQLDYPNSKPQPADLKAANADLAKKYGVLGFPTVIALKSDGTVLGRVEGYLPGGPKAMIAQIDGAKK